MFCNSGYLQSKSREYCRISLIQTFRESRMYCILEREPYSNSNSARMVQIKNMSLFFEWTAFKEFYFDSTVIKKDNCCWKKLANKSLTQKCKIIQSEDILEQFQTHQAGSDEKTLNDVAPEQGQWSLPLMF